MSSGNLTPLVKAAMYLALNMTESALTGNRKASVPLPSLTHGRAFHCPVFRSRPPAGTMQCRWGWKQSALPHVCSMAVIPSCTPCFLANASSVSHAAWNSAA